MESYINYKREVEIMSSKDIIDYFGKQMDELSSATNRTLTILNSAAFLAVLHFLSTGHASEASQLNGFFLTPLMAFAAGLTCILITAASNYFRALIAVEMGRDISAFLWISVSFSVFSGLLFLYGIWRIALNT